MPLENWIKCTDNDLTFARKIKNEGDKKNDIIAWEIIYDDYIKQQGLGKMMTKLIETIWKKTQAELNFVITNDRFILTQCEMLETKLEQMLNNGGKGMTISTTLIYLSKWMNTWINVKTITTKEYFDLLNEFSKEQKTLKDGQKNK